MYNKHLSRNQQFVFKGNEKHDNPQGTEGAHDPDYDPDSKLLLSSPKRSCDKKLTRNVYPHPCPRHIMRHFGPIPRRTQAFHIEKNVEVKLGLLSNLEQFEGEMIHLLTKYWCIICIQRISSHLNLFGLVPMTWIEANT